MDTFLKNYWSLYNDFLVKFESISYDGYSLAYLCHFPSFITEGSKLWNKLYEEAFLNDMDHVIYHPFEIQQKFNQYIASHMRKVRRQKGKIVIHQDKLMRIPQHILLHYFDMKNIIVLVANDKRVKRKKKVSVSQNPVIDGSKARQKYEVHYQITRVALNRYASSNTKDKVSIKKNAINLLNRYRHHIVFGSDEFRSWFLSRIETVIDRIEMSKRFFQEQKVSCLLVSTTHSYISRILTSVAAEHGIPSICLQHGIMSSELGYIPKIATIDAVYGSFERDWYQTLGVSETGLKIIGHPRFDQAFQKPKFTRQQFERKLALFPNKKKILIVVRGKKHLDRWRSFIKKLSKQLNVHILVKNYPGNKEHPLEKEFSCVFSTKGMSHYDIFPHVDVVITYSSTVALEAMLAKKHVFILKDDFEGYTNYFSLLENVVQSNPELLAPLIVKYFNDKTFQEEMERKRKQFLQYVYPNQTLSSKRLKHLIVELTKTV